MKKCSELGFGGQLSVRCANAQPFSCNEMGPLQVILGNSQAIRGPLSGNFQAISGDFRQFSGDFR